LEGCNISQDARQRTKVYLDTYLLNSAITKDNDSSQATFIVAFSYPDYPMERVFLDKNVDLIFSVGTPTTTALPVGIGYDEAVPIEIITIDKTDITGNKLRWKAEAELRRVVETYPTGSLRSLDRMEDNEQRLGSTTLYSAKYILRYKRYA